MIQSLQIWFQIHSAESQINPYWVEVADVATKVLRNSLLDLTSDNDKLRVLSLTNIWVLNSLQVLDPVQDAKQAFDIATRNKSVLLTKAIHEESLREKKDIPDSLMIRWQELIFQKERVMAQLLEKRSNDDFRSLRSRLNILQNESAFLLKQIEMKYPNFRKYRQNESQINL